MANEQKQQAMIVSIVAQTHIHPGVGQSTGALDLPVARERTTHYPFIPGSGVKGAFRVWSENKKRDIDTNKLFGNKEGDNGGDSNCGELLCSDARLLLLPVRCLSDAYKWVTCPAILKRFKRDCKRAGINNESMTITEPEDGEYLGCDGGTTDEVLGLEEREFKKISSGATIDENIIKALSPIIEESDLKKRLVILSDKDFTWFVRYALPVMARNVLDDNNKSSKNLWYEESLAPDTVMYLLFGERESGAVSYISDAIGGSKYIQIGGNETIGQGWFEMNEYKGAA